MRVEVSDIWHLRAEAWYINVDGDQERWQDFCESFMSDDIVVFRHWKQNEIVVTCRIDVDPYKPIDSTGSMPSFIDQAKQHRHGFVSIYVVRA